MIALRSTLTKVPGLLSQSGIQTRGIVSAPPRFRVSFTEKVVLGLVFYAGIVAIPAYISSNILTYRKMKGE